MINTSLKKRFFLIITVLSLGCFIILASMTWAQNLTHTVQKGDTLWGICEKYYGDPDHWPKLWQMNPFVTNPHLLNPGDIITLFKQEPVKKVETPKVEKKPPIEKAEPEPSIKGITVDGFTDIKTLGFLTLKKLTPWGTIFASEESKIILSKNDIAYVIMDKNRKVKSGDEFGIYTSSSLLKHPVTGKDLGYTFSIHGKLVIEGNIGQVHKKDGFHEKNNVYQAKITELYSPVQTDDLIMPYSSVSPCVLPVSYDKEFLGNIVSVKEDIIIRRYSVVYIDRGFNHGIRRGNMFEVVKSNILRSPDPADEDQQGFRYNMILPDIPIGIIMILESRPETSTALVLQAKEDIPRGAYIKNLPWVEPPEILSSFAECPID